MDLVDQFPGTTLEDPLDMAQSPLDSSQWYVAERGGRVLKLQAGGGEPSQVLDLSDRVVTDAEGGLLGLALHPDFATRPEIFLSYVVAGEEGIHKPRSVISRVPSLDGGSSFDLQNERVILTVDQLGNIHNGGDLQFGPDGFLYISFGDGGVWDLNQTAQDPGTYLGSILRIDVDAGSPYGIPADNPFVAGGGAPEVWALGLRNPYRISFDVETGDLWVGDVGSSAFEEVNIIRRGENYGWPVVAGHSCLYPGCDRTGLTDPVVEYTREAGCAVIGGFVYRGSSLPDLNGAYVFGDYCSSRIWAASPRGDGTFAMLELTTSPRPFQGFAQGSDGEVLVLALDAVYRIAPGTGPVGPQLPSRLSETGCVDPRNPHRPASGLIPYEVNEPFWSDGADKQRWLAIPDGTTVDIGEDGDFDLPIGTVAVKNYHFEDHLVETRLFMRHSDGGWAGYSYEWNDDESEAILLEGSKIRRVGSQDWTYPSRAQCMQCHTWIAGYSLGLEIAQLNGEILYEATGRRANQLETLAEIGLLSKPLPRPVNELPALSRETLDEAARGYLHVNCSNCHRLPNGPVLGLDLRFQSTTEELGVCDVPSLYRNVDVEEGRILAPGDPERSTLSIRAHLVGDGQMPPIARSIVDAEGTRLLDDWIASWPSCEGPSTAADLQLGSRSTTPSGRWVFYAVAVGAILMLAAMMLWWHLRS